MHRTGNIFHENIRTEQKKIDSHYYVYDPARVKCL